MNKQSRLKGFTLLQRELQEYRHSFLITPLVVASLLLLMILASVLLANRMILLDDSAMEILIDKHSGAIDISIDVDKDTSADQLIITDADEQASADEEDWDFAKDWNLDSSSRYQLSQQIGQQIGSLNPILNLLHVLFLVLLLVVSINYLLGSLHQDRLNRSVLFWKSMPVSEWEEIATKMATVYLVVAVIYMTLSFLTQIAYALLAMLLVWRLGMSPTQVVLENLNFTNLFIGQLESWLVWILFTAPFYAWLLFCSAAARRSPFMLALAIPLAIVVIEWMFFSSNWIGATYMNHLPLFAHEGEYLAFYMSPSWGSLDYAGLLVGLFIAGLLLTATVWFRKHRFEC